MRFIIAVIFGFFLLASFVQAVNSCNGIYCVIDSNVTSDTTWIDGNTYVLANDIYVRGSGVDLTIQPGVVIKYTQDAGLIIETNARIVANGAPDKNIIFTSCKDQSAYSGANNADTSGESGCSGQPGQFFVPDYNTAIWVKASSGMQTTDSFSYLRILYAGNGVMLEKRIKSVHDSSFEQFNGSLGGNFSSCSGVRATVQTDMNVYNNYFSNFAYCNGFLFNPSSEVFSGNIFNNSFSNFLGTPNHGIILLTRSTGNIYGNSFTNTSSMVVIYTSIFSGNIYDNIFADSTNFAYSILVSGSSGNFSGNIYGNQFLRANNLSALVIDDDADFSGSFYNNLLADGLFDPAILLADGTLGGYIVNNTFAGMSGRRVIHAFRPISAAIQRNLFTDAGGEALAGTFTGSVSNNAYYNVNTIGGSPTQHANDVNIDTGLTSPPFASGPIDKPYSLNSDPSGGALLVDAGLVPVDSFYGSRTTQPDNRLDIGIVDLGYHYPTSGPYVRVLSPNGGETIRGTYDVNFQVEPLFGTASNTTVSLGYSTDLVSRGTQITSQLLSNFSCTQPYAQSPNLYECTHVWDTVAGSVPDGTYYVVATATDLVTSYTDYSDSSFVVDNEFCGNNVKEGLEACDGPDLGGQTCQSQGFASGTLSCNATTCQFDTSGCNTAAPLPVCGNNVPEQGEQCDEGSLGGPTCSDECELLPGVGTCGDGTPDPNGADNVLGNDDDEECDRGLLGDSTCTGLCKKTFCGDGTIQTLNGFRQDEQCESSIPLPLTQTCQSVLAPFGPPPVYAGEVSCNSCMVDTSRCIEIRDLQIVSASITPDVFQKVPPAPQIRIGVASESDNIQIRLDLGTLDPNTGQPLPGSVYTYTGNYDFPPETNVRIINFDQSSAGFSTSNLLNLIPGSYYIRVELYDSVGTLKDSKTLFFTVIPSITTVPVDEAPLPFAPLVALFVLGVITLGQKKA